MAVVAPIKPTAAPAPVQPPAPAAQPLPTGWSDFGHNLVKNTATGQVLSRDMGAFKALLPPAGAPAATPAAPAAPAAPAGPVAPPPPTIQSNQAQAQQTISNILQQPLSLNTNDPQFQTGRAQLNLEAQRQREQQQSMAAERLSSQGLNTSGAMDTAALQAQQNEGATRLSGLNTLMNNQAQQKQANLQQALSLAQGAGLTQQAQDIQQSLAQLQAQLQREGYSTQKGIASQSNATNLQLGQGQLNLGLLNALMGNQQFNDNLGAQIGANQAGLTQGYLLSLLNG